MSEKTAAELQRIYEGRFASTKAYRNRVWQVVVKDFLQPRIGAEQTVLDLGCGYGEFINNVNCAKKFAMDLNPDAAQYLQADVTLIQQDCSDPWDLPNESLDVVFTSNFFEHLPTKDALAETLRHAMRALRPGGRLIAMGPNIRVLDRTYWDFWDHHIPISDRSLVEVLRFAGFGIEEVYPQFLPYSLVGAPQYPLWTVRAYLRFPVLWRIFGRQ
ncbi:MAG TPA: class I SAM-dependent methyltransferase, partial [Chthoniobacterales bacterium]|nr:class I SAM-dependent methyltransferase [Chthoniobacterales bacterium]